MIVIERGVYKSLSWVDKGPLAIITDCRVEKLYAKDLKKRLKGEGFQTYLFSFPEGEVSKTREVKASIEDEMQRCGLGRDTTIIAFGGGVVLDLAGFIAATYCRGVNLVSIPTTLLAMVDAAIGGKVGVNTSFGKNLIGAFYTPKKVVIDPIFLETLPEKEWRNGVAEILKYGLIKTPHLCEGLFTKDIVSIIKECVEIKSRVVEEDENEIGLRRILNFGHTIGHAIEVVSSYLISHGEAVAIGMFLESKMSAKLGFLKQDEVNAVEVLLKKAGFDLSLREGISKVVLKGALKMDKKSKNSLPRFVLLERLGKVAPFDGEYCTYVEERVIDEVL